jgi:hypothetical protein
MVYGRIEGSGELSSESYQIAFEGELLNGCDTLRSKLYVLGLCFDHQELLENINKKCA